MHQFCFEKPPKCHDAQMEKIEVQIHSIQSISFKTKRKEPWLDKGNVTMTTRNEVTVSPTWIEESTTGSIPWPDVHHFFQSLPLGTFSKGAAYQYETDNDPEHHRKRPYVLLHQSACRYAEFREVQIKANRMPVGGPRRPKPQKMFSLSHVRWAKFCKVFGFF